MKTIKLTSYSPEVFDDPKYCQNKNIGVSCDAIEKITAYMEDDIYVCLNFHAYGENEELYRDHRHGNGNLEKCNQCKDHYKKSKKQIRIGHNTKICDNCQQLPANCDCEYVDKTTNN